MKVAGLKLEALGISIDKIKPHQLEYMEGWETGT
jgi:adenosylhomocysteinase